MNSILSINWNLNPEFFHIGPFVIRYYSILFVSGFIIGYQMFIWFFKREHLPSSLLDPLLYVLLGCTLVGSRLGHVIFYEPSYYLANPIEIFKVWEGGLASHGGSIAILIGIWWYISKYGKKYGFGYIWLLDRIAIATAFASMFIRLGNFMNSEIYGHATNLPWGVIFLRNGETIAKHPTQLYEAFCYMITGLILLFIYKKYLHKIKDGLLLGIFFIGIFASRFFIEFVKEVQVSFEQGMTLNMGQWLSIPFVIFGIILIIRSFQKNTPYSMLKENPIAIKEINAINAEKSKNNKKSK